MRLASLLVLLVPLAASAQDLARGRALYERTYTLDEREDIVEYLNESHYRFGLPPRGAYKR